MKPVLGSTHELDIGAEQVTKRFRSWERGEPAREWHALVSLRQFAPGLAPAPLGADLTGDPPHVTMSRLPGVPLALCGRRPYAGARDS